MRVSLSRFSVAGPSSAPRARPPGRPPAAYTRPPAPPRPHTPPPPGGPGARGGPPRPIPVDLRYGLTIDFTASGSSKILASTLSHSYAEKVSTTSPCGVFWTIFDGIITPP